MSVLLNTSILNQQQFDYVDTYSRILPGGKTPTSTQIGKAFFTSAPPWVSGLFQLRNKIVKVFGLKTTGEANDRDAKLRAFKCEPGERLGLFKVFEKTENEVILGENDKHLNFRISLRIESKKTAVIHMTTAIQFHNRFGKVYFFFVKPFHKIIAPIMLKNIIKKL